VANASHATLGFGHHVRVTTNLVVLEADQVTRKGLATTGTFWVLTVADDGRGMSPALQTKIFEPFFTTKGEGEGTGIGLATCVSIVRGAGGYVSVESAPERGSTFRVFLPVAKTDHAAADTDGAASAAAIVTEGAPVVLVVEDNDAVRNLLARILTSEGLRVLEASTLAAGRALVRNGGIDLLVSDGHLPDGSGITLAREVIARAEGTAIVFISGDTAATLGFSADAVLQKPFRLEDAKRTILNLLKKRRLPMAELGRHDDA
jgi:CheY-like chemotaxis protein